MADKQGTFFAQFRVPQTDCTILAAGSQTFAVRAPCNCRDACRCAEDVNLTTCRIPDSDCSVSAAGGQALAVSAPCHREDLALMLTEGEKFLCVSHIPDLDRPIPAGRCQFLAVRT